MAQKNRFLLLGLMTAAGWDFYRNEWWHYQLFEARAKYPLIGDERFAGGRARRLTGAAGLHSMRQACSKA